MKNIFFSMLLVIALGIPAVANAYLIDTKIGEASINSGDSSELAWMRTVTGDSTLELDFKIDSTDGGFNFTSNGPDSWFIDVAPDTPGYFMLKFGTGGTDATADHFAFQNVADLTKLVWSNDQVQYLTGGDCANNSDSCNIGRLSHYIGATTDTSTQIPEPNSLFLLGLGLLGLMNVRKSRVS